MSRPGPWQPERKLFFQGKSLGTHGVRTPLFPLHLRAALVSCKLGFLTFTRF
jgi:hypothetical protein